MTLTPAPRRGFFFCAFASQMGGDTRQGARHPADMRDASPRPAFGDVVGLGLRYKEAVARIRRMGVPEGHRRAWIEELSRQHRAAREATTRAAATPTGQGGT